MYVCVAENVELLVFFYFFLHLPHRQFSFIDLCISSKMYWTFNCSLGNVMNWNVFFFCILHIFKNFPCRLGEKSKSLSFSRLYVCAKAKLTLVSFFFTFFSMHFSLTVNEYFPLYWNAEVWRSFLLVIYQSFMYFIYQNYVICCWKSFSFGMCI